MARISLAIALVIYSVAFLLLARPWLSGAVTIPWDAKAQSLPALQFLAQSLARGDSPFWTPNVFAGWPLIADPQSLIFSPVHLALAWLDPTLGFRAADGVTFAALFTGGAGILLLFRDQDWSLIGALIAALAFAFGGVDAARIQHTNEILSVSYLPVCLWLGARALRTRWWQTGALAGVVIGLLASDRDQVAMLSLYAVLGWLILHSPGERRRRSGSALIAMAAAAGAVAIVPIVLTTLLAQISNRPEIAYQVARTGSLHPALLLSLVFPDVFGASGGNYWGPPSGAWEVPDLSFAQNMGALYPGAIAIAAIGLGVMRGTLWSREIRYFSIAVGVALLYALGRYTPAFHVLFDLIPGVSLWRRPADAAFLMDAFLSIIAGYQVHRWLSDADADIGVERIVVGVGVIGATTIAAVAIALVHHRWSQAMGPLGLGLLTVAGAVSVLAIARRLRHAQVACALLVVAFVVADLAWNNGPNPSTGVAPSVYDAMRPDTSNETIRLLKSKLAETGGADRRDRVELVGLGYHWPNIGLIHDLDHVFGQNPLRLQEFDEATGAGDTVAAVGQRRFSALYPSYRSVFANLLGVRFIVSGVPVEKIDRQLTPEDLTFIAQTADGYMYENPHALPRVMVVTSWMKADFASLVRDGWPNVDPLQTVLLEQAPPQPVLPGGGTKNAASLVAYGHSRVVVDVHVPNGGFLVLNDVWHPWWQAKVDDQAAPILRANVLFRAVQVPPGDHIVRFEFNVAAGVARQIGALIARAPNATP